MRREPEVRYAVLKNLTDELIADATRALDDLVKSLARTSACDELGIQLAMDDPEVAREVLKMTFEAVFLSSPKKRKRQASATSLKAVKPPAPGRRCAPRTARGPWSAAARPSMTARQAARH